MSVLITRYAVPFTGSVDTFAKLKQVYTIYASDSFTRADADVPGSTTVGAKPWLSAAGNVFGIRSNRLVKISATTQPHNVVFNTGFADFTYHATLVNDTNAGIVFRETADGTGGGWMVWKEGGVYTLTKRTGAAVYTHVAKGSNRVPVVGDRVSVILKGSSITVRVNGTTVITHTDAAYSTQTHAGIWIAPTLTASFDDLEVTAQTEISAYE